MSLVRRFVYGYLDSLVIDGQGIQPDPDLAARNAERAKKVIQRMGPKHCLWNPRPPIDLAAANEELELAAHSRGNE